MQLSDKAMFLFGESLSTSNRRDPIVKVSDNRSTGSAATDDGTGSWLVERPQVIRLPQHHAVVPQDVVRGRGMEIDVRRRELRQVVESAERMRLPANRTRDLARLGAFELLRVEAFHVIDRARDARDKVIETLFLVLV